MKDKRYVTYSHAKTKIRYHLIFSTKYRAKCLEGIHDEVLAAFRQTESASDFTLYDIETDKDHIHMMIEIKPSISVDQAVRRLKQMTTHILWDRDGEWLRKFYWGPKRKLWSGGYFCATVGDASEDTIRKYIENQG
jgi:putative transposase